ncbi:MAG: hypothetical protein CEE38_21185 [Planctomycetes bacterium B3_Pla]|nr:MAG: hypothetical protein CEE38_21185 [Planctomycetes bacterium B3_Pla]
MKQDTSVSFLSGKTKELLSKVATGENLTKERDQLLKKVWPAVLRDALKILKKNDPREWPKGKDSTIGTFFDEASLGVSDLQEVLSGFSDFEGVMYGASPEQYRDHVVHSFRVWIIGQGLLKECFDGKLTTDAKLQSPISSEEWECMWALVALCHDIGYPLSQLERVNELARKAFTQQGLLPQGDLRFAFSQQMQPFHDTVIRLMASKPVILAESVRPPKGEDKSEEEKVYVTHLQNKYYMKFLKSFDNLDHGVVSSLLISKALMYFLESDLCHDWWSPLTEQDARQFLIRREILRAIASHTCPDIYHLEFNTLSFLLYMADEIQCWGRPTLAKLQEEPAGTMNGQVQVKEFSKTRIDIIISTNDEDWDKDLQEAIEKKWVGRLRKMLRLALDTQKLKNSYLRFQVENRASQKCYLELKDAKLIGPKLEG